MTKSISKYLMNAFLIYSLIFTFLMVDISTLKASDNPDESINLEIDEDEWKPGKAVTVRAIVVSSTGNEYVTFELDDPRGNTLLVQTEDITEDYEAEITFRIPSNVTYGEYMVYATTETLRTERSTNIKDTWDSEEEEPVSSITGSFSFRLFVLILTILLIFIIFLIFILKKKRQEEEKLS